MDSFLSEIKISKDVFVTICKIALAEIEHIASVDKVHLSGRLFDEYASANRLSIHLYLTVQYGCNIQNLVDDVNRVVAGCITKMIGLAPDSINIYITDMTVPPTSKKSGIGG